MHGQGKQLKSAPTYTWRSDKSVTTQPIQVAVLQMHLSGALLRAGHVADESQALMRHGRIGRKCLQDTVQVHGLHRR